MSRVVGEGGVGRPLHQIVVVDVSIASELVCSADDGGRGHVQVEGRVEEVGARS